MRSWLSWRIRKRILHRSYDWSWDEIEWSPVKVEQKTNASNPIQICLPLLAPWSYCRGISSILVVIQTLDFLQKGPGYESLEWGDASSVSRKLCTSAPQVDRQCPKYIQSVLANIPYIYSFRLPLMYQKSQGYVESGF